MARKGIKVTIETTIWYSDEDVQPDNFETWEQLVERVESWNNKDNASEILESTFEKTYDLLEYADKITTEIIDDPHNS